MVVHVVRLRALIDVYRGDGLVRVLPSQWISTLMSSEWKGPLEGRYVGEVVLLKGMHVFSWALSLLLCFLVARGELFGSATSFPLTAS